LVFQVGVGANKRNGKYNTPVLGELSERGKSVERLSDCFRQLCSGPSLSNDAIILC